jgi:DNA-binding NarL/FixJ family response regulator
MDVNMPVMDGIEATRHITHVLPMAAIIGLSVQTADHVETAMKEAGALAFLNKEAAVEDLYKTIQAVCKQKLSPK